MTPAVRVLVVDNYDSFVHTLVGYLHELGAGTVWIEADEITDIAHAFVGVDAVMISPGPGTPEDAGASIDVVHAAIAADIPLLGVCLGHQAIAAALGGRVAATAHLMHGIGSEVDHDEQGVFQGIPSPMTVGRYHSLAIDPVELPADLRVTARASDGVVMAVEHRTARVVGVQFHPESVLTEGGYRLLGNWLESVGLVGAAQRGANLSPHIGRAES